MAEGVAVGPVPAPEREYDFENETEFRRALEAFMDDVDARIARIEDENTQVGTMFMPAAGRWFRVALNADATTDTLVLTADRLYLATFRPDRTVTTAELGFNVTGGAGTKARLGIYDDSGGVPDSLLVETGDLDPSTTGDKTGAAVQALTAGVQYWLALASDGGTTVRSLADDDMMSLGHTAPDEAAHATHAHHTLAGGWSALPAGSLSLTWGTGNVPLMGAKL